MDHMIRGYPDRPSVLPGEILRLHIAAEAPLWFQIWFYRQGEALVLKARTEEMSAHVRPGGGVGGRPWDHYFPDYYDQSSLRQTFWHWDALFISWLERRRFEVDYCTDLDIHENLGNFLGAYRLLLSVGHDEYWSEAMRH